MTQLVCCSHDMERKQPPEHSFSSMAFVERKINSSFHPQNRRQQLKTAAFPRQTLIPDALPVHLRFCKDRSRVARAAWGGGVCALGLLCGVSGVCGRRVSIVTPEPTPERWSRPGASSGTAAGVAPSLCTFGPKVNSVSGPAQSCPMEIGYKPPNGSTKRATERGEDEFSAASCLTHDVQTHHPIAHLLPARFLETHLQHISVGLVAAAGKWGQVLVPLLSWSLCSCQRRQTINLKCVSG